MHHTASATDQGKQRAAGIALIASTIISIVTVAMDVGATGSNKAEVLASMVSIGVRHQLVHVVALCCLLGFGFGVTALAQRAGLRRAPVLAGLICYLTGCVAMMGAVLMDGFVTVDLARAYASAPAADQLIGYNMIQYSYIILQNLANIAWMMQALGVLVFSTALLRERRVLAMTGLVTGALPAIAIIATYPQMGLTLVVGIMLAQSLWHIGAGVSLLRGDVGAGSRMPMAAAA